MVNNGSVILTSIVIPTIALEGVWVSSVTKKWGEHLSGLIIPFRFLVRTRDHILPPKLMEQYHDPSYKATYEAYIWLWVPPGRCDNYPPVTAGLPQLKAVQLGDDQASQFADLHVEVPAEICSGDISGSGCLENPACSIDKAAKLTWVAWRFHENPPFITIVFMLVNSNR